MTQPPNNTRHQSPVPATELVRAMRERNVARRAEVLRRVASLRRIAALLRAGAR